MPARVRAGWDHAIAMDDYDNALSSGLLEVSVISAPDIFKQIATYCINGTFDEVK